MNKMTGFKKKSIAAAVATMAGFSGQLLAQAEQTPDSALEEVVVVGIRGSLEKSADIKRDAQGVVDAISAEDIGKFPDTNLAESMQRISGVSIDRVNGEGSKVTVRGINPDFNLVTLNGRQLARTTGGRSFDFQNIASEMVHGVLVAKSSNALAPSGGIGSTIDLLTARPLEIGEQRLQFAAKGVADQSSDDSGITPEMSGFYSDTFADGKVGVAISASVAERESGAAIATVNEGWRSFPGWVDQDWAGGTADWGGVPQENQVNRPGEGDIYSVPQAVGYKFEEQQRKRTNGSLVLQWAPTDDFTATVDYMYYANDITKEFNDISAWYNFGASENVWTDGPIATPIIYAEYYDPAAPADLSMGAGVSAEAHRGQALGLNAEWQVNDRLSLAFDASFSDAERRPDSPWGSSALLSTTAFVRTSAITDFTGERPMLSVGGGNEVQASDMEVTGSVFTNSRDRSDIEAYRFSGNFELNESSDIDFGISLQEVSNHSQMAVVQRDAWAGAGDPSDLDDALFTAKSIQDKFDSAGGDFSEIGGAEPLNTYFDWDFVTVRAIAEDLYGGDLWPSLIGDCGTQFCASTDYTNATDRTTVETSAAAFAQYNFQSEMFGMPYDLNVGLRYETTEVDSKAASPVYDEVLWVAANELSLNPAGTGFLSQTADYDYVLPSANFRLNLKDDLVLRLAASETIGRPDYDSIKGGTVVGQLAREDGGSGSSGNPALLPTESTNFDLSLEWYYDEGSYASIGYFNKRISNFISSATSEGVDVFGIATPINGARYQAAVDAGAQGNVEIRDYIFANFASDPYVDVDGGIIYGNPAEDPTILFDLSVPGNGDHKDTLDGLELSVQHMFGDTGFGVVANYTIVDSKYEYDPFQLVDQEAMIGLSDTANLVAFYDKNGLQARVAYNWRDDFLSSRGQNTGANPQFTEAYSQVDLNVSYEVQQVEGLEVFLEGLNVTEEYGRVYGRSSSQVLGVYEGGARWQFGARYAF
ncbi:TonB-dependent receptor [Microbulbifer agarilyticus]|uniref:TonB-dependent receptor n=1 Tax=Microbulbifer agarilyticus TaxID=260552 RepID=UPI001C95A4A2|nr:TonB-dependent receptor [Microbulbifer agarilyticus]MBY6192024.1 TonB-dependent receptor [Microbulbifer agarilyticus]